MSTKTVDREFELRNAQIQFFLSAEKLLNLAEVAKRDHDQLMQLITNRAEDKTVGRTATGGSSDD